MNGTLNAKGRNASVIRRLQRLVRFPFCVEFLALLFVFLPFEHLREDSFQLVFGPSCGVILLGREPRVSSVLMEGKFVMVDFVKKGAHSHRSNVDGICIVGWDLCKVLEIDFNVVPFRASNRHVSARRIPFSVGILVEKDNMPNAKDQLWLDLPECTVDEQRDFVMLCRLSGINDLHG